MDGAGARALYSHLEILNRRLVFGLSVSRELLAACCWRGYLASFTSIVKKKLPCHSTLGTSC